MKNAKNTLKKIENVKSIKFICDFHYLFLAIFFSQSFLGQSIPSYYGTSAYPYWGKYSETLISDVKAPAWIDNDNIVVGWDWSLPDFVKAPSKSTFSLRRVSGLNPKPITQLSSPSFKCNPVVSHWIKWNELEAVKDKYTFAGLISNIKLAASKGYKSIVRIHTSATTFAPTWMDTDLNVPKLVQNPGDDVQNYDVSDARFHDRYLKLIAQVGKEGIPKMPEVVGLYLGYASKSNGDEGIGPIHRDPDSNDDIPHVKERIEAWADITVGVREKVFMGGPSNLGMSKGFGLRRGWVEKYLNNIPNEYIGQKVDSNGYLYVDENNDIVKENLFHGDENEEYSPKWSTSETDFRFGTSTESFGYRNFSSYLRVLQMRCNDVLNYENAILPEMFTWVGLELGCTVQEAPDVWCFLRESYLKPAISLKNFERWLYQRDATGYTTTPVIKMNHTFDLSTVQVGKEYDYIARQGKKIGFNISENWNLSKTMAFKVSVIDNFSGTLNLNYFNGSKTVTVSKSLEGNGVLKTYTFFLSDFKLGKGKMPNNFDFTLEAGSNTENIVVSFVRVVRADTNLSVSSDEIQDKSYIEVVYNKDTNAIKAFSDVNITKVEVYNISGQLVKSVESQLPNLVIASSDLPKGIYILKFFDNANFLENQKIVVY